MREFIEFLKVKQMNGKIFATFGIAKVWDSIDRNKAEAYIKKLHTIVKAHQQGRTGKVKSSQWLLTQFFMDVL